MVVLLANALISTSRSQINPSNQATGPAQAVLVGQPAHIEPTRSETDDLMDMHSAAVRTEMIAYVEADTDIRINDWVTALTLMDGITPYPQLTLSGVPNEQLMVSFVIASAPGPLHHRQVLISRYITGGQAYT